MGKVARSAGWGYASNGRGLLEAANEPAD